MRRLGENKNLNLDNFAWKNSNAEVVKNLTCYIPKNIHNVVRSANSALKSTEFSFLLKCDIDWEAGVVNVSDEWYFPEQDVSAAAVHYKEDMSSFNGVMHKHPGQMRTFSGTDNEWINQNFEVSILWVDDEFCNGRINIPSPAGKIQLPLNVIVEADFEIMEDVVEIVNKKATKIVNTYQSKSAASTAATSQTRLWGSGAVNSFPGTQTDQEFEPIALIEDLDELDSMSDEEFALACMRTGCLDNIDWEEENPFYVDANGDSLKTDKD